MNRKVEQLRAAAYYEAGLAFGQRIFNTRVDRGPSIDPEITSRVGFPIMWLDDGGAFLTPRCAKARVIIPLFAEVAQKRCNLPTQDNENSPLSTESFISHLIDSELEIDAFIKQSNARTAEQMNVVFWPIIEAVANAWMERGALTSLQVRDIWLQTVNSRSKAAA